jgi:hypothetical protein
VKECDKSATTDGVCLYCEVELKYGHEHDHFPIPQRLGGEVTWCVCRGCHDKKDRIPLRHWSLTVVFAALAGLWSKATTDERLLLAKIMTIMLDAQERLGAKWPKQYAKGDEA